MNRSSFSRRPEPRRRLRSRGFTLVELLVAIVILGFVMTLVSEALFQVSQLTRTAEAANQRMAERWRSGWGAAEVFANLVIPEEVNGQPLVGTPERVSGFSARSLGKPQTGVQPFTLVLQALESTTRDAPFGLFSQPPGQARPDLVAQFPGRARFHYVDRLGAGSDTWPPIGRRADREDLLPVAVEVRSSADSSVLFHYSFGGETERPPQRGRSPFDPQ